MTEIKQFAKAFIAAQAQMGNATKDSDNPFFKSKYADLNSVREACLPALNANGIAVLQPIIQIDGKNFVKTLLLHESGESMESLTEIVYSKQNDAQAQGSGITYARRYGLQSLVNIGAEDDDGNKASQPKTDKQKLANIANEMAPEISKMKVDERARKDLEKTPEQRKAAAVKVCNGYKAKIDASTSAEEIEFYFDDPEVSAIMKSLEERQSELYKDLMDYKDGRIQILQTNINN